MSKGLKGQWGLARQVLAVGHVPHVINHEIRAKAPE